MRIGFLGNQNNYPFTLARALRRLGHDVRVVIDRPEPLDRPETRYADVSRPYPEWIIELPAVEIHDIVYDTRRWHAALDAVRDCDALVLNKTFYDAASRLPIPAVCMTTGGDIEFGAHYGSTEAYVHTVISAARNRRWIRDAFELPALDGPSLRDWLEKSPTPLFRLWRKHVYRRFIAKQRAGLRRAVAINGFPDGVSGPGTEVLRNCLGPGAQRLCLLIADVAWIRPSPPPNNSPLRLFNAARVLWQLPFPPLVGEWENKGTDVLIHGAALWHRRTGRPLDMRFAEKGLSVAATKALLSNLGLEQFATWRPEMSQQDVLDEYARADVVVEQLGNHVLGMAGYEAMAAGRPVLANGRPELYEKVYGAPPPVAQARTPEEVAEQLERLCDPAHRQSLAARGRQFVETHLNPDRAALKVASIFEEALAPRRAGTRLAPCVETHRQPAA